MSESLFILRACHPLCGYSWKTSMVADLAGAGGPGSRVLSVDLGRQSGSKGPSVQEQVAPWSLS